MRGRLKKDHAQKTDKYVLQPEDKHSSATLTYLAPPIWVLPHHSLALICLLADLSTTIVAYSYKCTVNRLVVIGQWWLK